MEAWKEDCLLHVGAEAAVSSGLFLGLPAVRKVRSPRGYRHPDLDRRLTSRRMSAEARMLTRLAESGLPVPRLLALDTEKGEMIQSRMPGKQLIDALRSVGDDGQNPHQTELSLQAAGGVIRQLHGRGAVHGDLTTNNLLWDDDAGISLIDFGLSSWTTEVERMGLDLQVIHECLTASHPEHSDAMAQVLIGYREEPAVEWLGSDTPPPNADEVLARFDKIRSRVRYHS